VELDCHDAKEWVEGRLLSRRGTAQGWNDPEEQQKTARELEELLGNSEAWSLDDLDCSEFPCVIGVQLTSDHPTERLQQEGWRIGPSYHDDGRWVGAIYREDLPEEAEVRTAWRTKHAYREGRE